MTMRIHRLTAENVLRLVAVDITPETDVVEITGRNGAGKSSILNAIFLALAGKAATKDIKEPIRDGEDSAHVRVDLGDIIVERRWKGDKSTLTVTSKDGAQYKGPQAFLDERLGALSFDPLAFSSMPDKEQLTTLLALVDLPFDPEQLAGQRMAIFERRRLVGQERTKLEGALDGIPRPQNIPAEVSMAALAAEYQAAQDLATAKRRAAERCLDSDDRVREAHAAIKRATTALVAAEAEQDSSHAALDAMADPPDLLEITARMQEVEQTNAAARAEADAELHWEAFDQADGQYKDYTSQLDAIDQRKAEALAAAKMPIEGLSFDDNGVLYRSNPEAPYVRFKQCSAAERLRVGMSIAIAADPEIRILRITDGSLLDGENRKLIAEMCAEHDFQAFLEIVGEGSDVGFEISEGVVVNRPEQEEPA